jgi:tRNA dimethylallyltransferase
VLAVLGPTASGKSALGLSLAERHNGEIINCDSTAVYRGFDIGTDKVSVEARRGVRHHLIDIADPTEVYTAAQYARDASAAIRDIHQQGRLPILVGGTGFYYRALTRGLFPGPGADEQLRSRLNRIADARGPERLHRLLQRIDPESAARIMTRDRKRLVRALEVYYTTGRPLTSHFTDTMSPIADCEVVAVALRLPPALTAERVARRSSHAAGSWCAARCETVRRSRVSTGDGDAARGARRSRNTRAHRPGEPSIRAPPVDLVP